MPNTKRLLISFASGVAIAMTLILVVILTDRGSGLPVLVRHPLAYIIFWPELFLIKDNPIADLMYNVGLYSLLVNMLLLWRGKLTISAH